jgi:hypothetical protein
MSDRSGATIRAGTAHENGRPEDRRQSTRYKLRDARGLMSWDEGSERVACDVEVLNISGGGAALLAERAPAAGRSVRLQLRSKSAVLEPVEARSLSVAADPSGNQLVRVQFSHWLALDAILEHHQERRLWQRFPVCQTRAKLTWLDAGSEKSVPVELLNISGGGAAVIVDAIAPADEPIWFELAADGKVLDPVESRLVVTSLDPSGSTIARITFIDPCPMALFELAVNGCA